MRKAIKVWFVETGHPSNREIRIEVTPAWVRNGYKHFGLVDEPEIEGAAEVVLFDEHVSSGMFLPGHAAEYEVVAAAAIRDWAARETKAMETEAFHKWAKANEPERYEAACEPGHRKDRKTLREKFQELTGVMVYWY